MSIVLTAEVVRKFVQHQKDKANTPIDELAEKKYKQEWCKRMRMVERGELDTHPFVGLMANYKG